MQIAEKITEEKPKIGKEFDVTVRAMDESEAAEFVKNNPGSDRNQRGKNSGRGRGRGGNRHAGRGQKRDREGAEDEPQAKAAKPDAAEVEA
jgi:hypothetical protein